MFKIIGLITVAALISCAALLFPGATRVESSTPNGTLKGDRLDVRTRGSACSELAWPYYDSGCLYGSTQPADEVHKVRIISIDCRPL